MREFVVITPRDVSLIKAASAKEVLATSDVLRVIPYREKVKKISDINLAHAASDLSTMLKSGIDLSMAMNSVIESKEDDVAVALFHVKQLIEKGIDIADAFKQVNAFPEQFVEALKVGSARGKLQEVLQHLASYYSARGNVRSKIAIAMFMPDATIIVTAIAFLYMLYSLFPKLKQFAMDSGINHFGILTSTFLWMSDNIVFVGIVMITLLTLYFMKKDTVLMTIPKIGKTYKALLDHLDSYAVSSIAGLVLSTGMEITDALKYSIKGIRNKKMKKELEQAIVEIERGGSISTAFSKRDIPSALRSVVVIGERSGTMADMFIRLSNSLEENIVNDIKAVEDTMPVAMTLAVAPIVAFVLFSFYGSYFFILARIMNTIQK